jgi:hypothetical protein
VAAVENDRDMSPASRGFGHKLGEFLVGEVIAAGTTAVMQHQRLVEVIRF